VIVGEVDRVRTIYAIVLACLCVTARAAPPPDASGRFSDWFRSLAVPGNRGIMCCTAADCRMVASRWNDLTHHHEANVEREKFVYRPSRPALSQEDENAYEGARGAWTAQWVRRYGNADNVWIEVPDDKINAVPNPTGHSVLCWSVFAGVYCFVPFVAATNEHFDRRAFLA
jgi:hypothetical protein